MDNVLEIKELSKRYPSFYLDNVSFNLEKGKIMGFIGRNGAGKTTTLKAIVNLIKKDSGTVKMFGLDFDSNEKECKNKISFLLGGIDYYQRTKLKNITKVFSKFYTTFNHDSYKYYLKVFNIDENKTFKELSNGMKIKYQLAINLSHNSELLILDEPTSGLDPVSRDEIVNIFKSIVRDSKRSILFSTHITSDLEKCADDITYISNGKIILSSTKDEFINSFIMIEGNINELDNIKNDLVSYEIDKDKFKGLAFNKKIDSNNITINKPTLEDIIIYYERGNYEELTL